jgi:hypothetical protein
MGQTRKNQQQKNQQQQQQQQQGGMMTVGSKSQVYHGTAKHTSGGLTKKDLMKTKKGRIVSKKKHAAGLKAVKQLKKAGYVAKKGTFKLFRKH